MLLTLLLTALPACRTWSAPPFPRAPTLAATGLRAHPALITHPTPESRADLARAISEALHGAPVRLADDALTRDSLVVVGRAQARDVNGIPLNGRELGRPQHFRLLRRGSQCVLLHVETGKWRALRHTTCRVSPEGHASN